MKAACFLHVHFIDYNEKANQKSQQGRGLHRHVFSWSSITSPCPEDPLVLRCLHEMCPQLKEIWQKCESSCFLWPWQPVLLASFQLWGWYFQSFSTLECCISIKISSILTLKPLGGSKNLSERFWGQRGSFIHLKGNRKESHPVLT